ncbi:hypothetical protein V8E54_004430 [Elaphomyces granulatus]
MEPSYSQISPMIESSSVAASAAEHPKSTVNSSGDESDTRSNRRGHNAPPHILPFLTASSGRSSLAYIMRFDKDPFSSPEDDSSRKVLSFTALAKMRHYKKRGHQKFVGKCIWHFSSAEVLERFLFAHCHNLALHTRHIALEIHANDTETWPEIRKLIHSLFMYGAMMPRLQIVEINSRYADMKGLAYDNHNEQWCRIRYLVTQCRSLRHTFGV